MPVTPTYPGVYIEELPSGVHTIVGASTSETAFIDFFERGPTERAVRITSFSEFERVFGGLHANSEASYAIMQYFLNGGSIAWVVRVVPSDAEAAHSLAAAPGDGNHNITIHAKNPGSWGNNLQVGVDANIHPNPSNLFNLVVREVDNAAAPTRVVATEVFRNLSTDPNYTHYAVEEINHSSTLINLDSVDPAFNITDFINRINSNATNDPSSVGDRVNGAIDIGDIDLISQASDPSKYPYLFVSLSGGENGTDPGTITNGSEQSPTFQTALDRLDSTSFNLLCLPGCAAVQSMEAYYALAAKKCLDNRAFLIMDVPHEINHHNLVQAWVQGLSISDQDHAAVYYPRITVPDPLNKNRPREIGPSGTLAGLYARTDTERGVWKAPAGTEATLAGVTLTDELTDAENGLINPLGINALRVLPTFGTLAWGARTLDGADVKSSDFKYIPVRRLTSYIETSLYEGSKWAVFEPNDETLWAQLRLSIGTFMADLQKQGAFYRHVVTCDDSTTTPSDIERGVVNVVVAFAPVKPAEFVVLKIQQLAAQTGA